MKIKLALNYQSTIKKLSIDIRHMLQLYVSYELKNKETIQGKHGVLKSLVQYYLDSFRIWKESNSMLPCVQYYRGAPWRIYTGFHKGAVPGLTFSLLWQRHRPKGDHGLPKYSTKCVRWNLIENALVPEGGWGKNRHAVNKRRDIEPNSHGPKTARQRQIKINCVTEMSLEVDGLP